MSIYCSTFSIDDDWGEHPNRAPIVYQHSGVLPSNKDKRGGGVDIAAIPGHISRANRKALSNDNHPYHPWLRFGVRTDKDDATVILTRKQVELLRDELNIWIELSLTPKP